MLVLCRAERRGRCRWEFLDKEVVMVRLRAETLHVYCCVLRRVEERSLALFGVLAWIWLGTFSFALAHGVDVDIREKGDGLEAARMLVGISARFDLLTERECPSRLNNVSWWHLSYCFTNNSCFDAGCVEHPVRHAEGGWLRPTSPGVRQLAVRGKLCCQYPAAPDAPLTGQVHLLPMFTSDYLSLAILTTRSEGHTHT